MPIVFSFLLLCCSSNNKSDKDFEKYLSNFKDIELPFSNFGKNRKNIIFNATYENAIKKDYFEKYINDSDNLVTSPNYNYGVKYYKGNLIVVIVHKFYDSQQDLYKFDLLEELLIVYNQEGAILSKEVISKTSSMWENQTIFEDDYTIQVRQIKILEFSAVDVGDIKDCEVSYWLYNIADDGIITKHLEKQEKAQVRVCATDDYLYELLP